MLPAKQNYDIHDKELLAIMQPLKTFWHYLKGHSIPFEIWTDHNNLAYFQTKQKLSHRQACWSLFLSQFNFTIIHKLGNMNKANALSRWPDHKEGMPSEGGEAQILLNSKFFSVHATWPTALDTQDTSLWQRIKNAQTYDTEVSLALEAILKNGPQSLTKGLEDWNLEDGIILHWGHIYILKDDNLRQDIVKQYHKHPATGHPGCWKTYELQFNAGISDIWLSQRLPPPLLPQNSFNLYKN